MVRNLSCKFCLFTWKLKLNGCIVFHLIKFHFIQQKLQPHHICALLLCRLCCVLWINSIHNFDQQHKKISLLEFNIQLAWKPIIEGNLVNFFQLAKICWMLIEIFSYKTFSKTSENIFFFIIHFPSLLTNVGERKKNSVRWKVVNSNDLSLKRNFIKNINCIKNMNIRGKSWIQHMLLRLKLKFILRENLIVNFYQGMFNIRKMTKMTQLIKL